MPLGWHCLLVKCPATNSCTPCVPSWISTRLFCAKPAQFSFPPCCFLPACLILQAFSRWASGPDNWNLTRIPGKLDSIIALVISYCTAPIRVSLQVASNVTINYSLQSNSAVGAMTTHSSLARCTYKRITKVLELYALLKPICNNTRTLFETHTFQTFRSSSRAE